MMLQLDPLYIDTCIQYYIIKQQAHNSICSDEEMGKKRECVYVCDAENERENEKESV